MSASSSSLLPSLYLALCATQKNVEGVNKQMSNAGTCLPGSQIYPLPSLILCVAVQEALTGTLGGLRSNGGNALNLPACKVLSTPYL